MFPSQQPRLKEQALQAGETVRGAARHLPFTH